MSTFLLMLHTLYLTGNIVILKFEKVKFFELNIQKLSDMSFDPLEEGLIYQKLRYKEKVFRVNTVKEYITTHEGEIYILLEDIRDIVPGATKLFINKDGEMYPIAFVYESILLDKYRRKNQRKVPFMMRAYPELILDVYVPGDFEKK